MSARGQRDVGAQLARPLRRRPGVVPLRRRRQPLVVKPAAVHLALGGAQQLAPLDAQERVVRALVVPLAGATQPLAAARVGRSEDDKKFVTIHLKIKQIVETAFDLQ